LPPAITQQAKVKAGTVCLAILQDMTTLLTHVYRTPSKKKTVVYIEASEDLTKWLEHAHAHHAALEPLYPPTLYPPIPWRDQEVGGYINLPLSLVKRKGAGAPLSRTVMNGVNAYQSTPWEVNERLLGVMQEAWERGGGFGGLPSAEVEEFPVKPHDIETNEEARKKYGRECAWVRSRRGIETAKRMRISGLLHLAKKYMGDTIYMPANLDFRGRMYAVPSGLQPQGCKWARSLLRFVKGRHIDSPDAEEAFFIHGANAYGIKGTIGERVAWVKANGKEIWACAEFPLDTKMWSAAADPWGFLAWAFEFAEYRTDPAKALNYIPITVDAANNGCQIWALLLRDKRTASSTNVVLSDSGPRDLYSEVAEKVLKHLSLDVTPESFAWQKRGVTRDRVKKAVLSIPYGATQVGIALSIEKELEEEEGKPTMEEMKDRRRQAILLSEYIRLATLAVIPAVMKGMEWVQHVAHVAAEDHKLPCSWVAPSGFVVENKYNHNRLRPVYTYYGGKYMVSYLNEPEERIHVGRCVRTVMANMTHSVDAAIMAAVLSEADKQGIHCLHAVFDCFGTHAKDAAKLKKILLDTVATMFSDECFLNDFRERMLKELPEGTYLSEPPIVGDFDPSEVRGSIYFAS
jgi:DNA-directed RNA polymerase